VRLVNVAVGPKVESVFLVFECVPPAQTLPAAELTSPPLWASRYCSHDLSGLMERMSQPFSEAEVKRIMLQLLSAVCYMHSRWILHRDLKMSNVLYTDKGEIKLAGDSPILFLCLLLPLKLARGADFGLARPFGDASAKLTPRVVTLWYRCPELLFGCSTYATPMDMWAVGCIFAELLLHAPLIPGGTELKQINLMCQLLGSPNPKIWPGFQDLSAVRSGMRLPDQPFNNLSRRFPRLSASGLDLLNQFLTYDPARRISAAAALHHPYFDESPKAKPSNEMPTFPQFNGLQLRATKRKADAVAEGGGSGAARSKQDHGAKK
jgi:serine/threonine protein kinase